MGTLMVKIDKLMNIQKIKYILKNQYSFANPLGCLYNGSKQYPTFCESKYFERAVLLYQILSVKKYICRLWSQTQLYIYTSVQRKKRRKQPLLCRIHIYTAVSGW